MKRFLLAVALLSSSLAAQFDLQAVAGTGCGGGPGGTAPLRPWLEKTTYNPWVMRFTMHQSTRTAALYLGIPPLHAPPIPIPLPGTTCAIYVNSFANWTLPTAGTLVLLTPGNNK